MGSEAALAEGFLSSVNPCVDLLGPEAVCSGKGLEGIHGLSPSAQDRGKMFPTCDFLQVWL